MDLKTVQRCLDILKASPSIDTVDITGGAPELNPHFRKLVKEARAMGKVVIDRCNLAVLFENGQQDLARFLSEQDVNIVASLPCYTPDNTDRQRGKRVFDDSITAIKILNDQGFGRNTNSSATSHRLDLVFNPGGASLPPSQPVLETEYRRRLWDDHEITFDSLFTLTNMPIKRFADTLFQTGQYTEYMQLLANSFNASTIAGLMCRFTVNVAWDGKIYDCDFNAALDLGSQMPRQQDRTDTALDIWKLDNVADLRGALIRTKKHCFGCTAGSGSSCGGALT
ncbi:hypothetical protein C1H76_2807 [Elsinoe australis]|uniref:Arsenosugar biosynthesis radical SAM protein ArsS-like C-terminal domain-containing protein n=1 Tax=Elsinoe australis TaxID=40998 RepID=A0A4U7B9N1_9PEZI|nr:hypothetical protein C1H76_2807 [Elsinoe australis]